MHGSCMWEIYVIRGILDCARWNNIGPTAYAFYCKLQAIIKSTGSTCMYIYIKILRTGMRQKELQKLPLVLVSFGFVSTFRASTIC